MQDAKKRNFKELLQELNIFIEQSEKIDVDKFIEWKESVLELLPVNYKARFAKLDFISAEEIDDNINFEDDIPF